MRIGSNMVGGKRARRFMLLFACASSLMAEHAGPQLVRQYCIVCHSEKLKTAGLVLEGLDATHPEARPDVWEKVIRKLQTGEMPPNGMPRPTPEARHDFLIALESDLDQAAAKQPNPGRPVIHRLNRVEYANAVRDLLSLDVDPSAELPPDPPKNGFDNIGDALSLSPVLLEKYLKAARLVSRLAVGDPAAPLAVDEYVANDAQSEWMGEDLPFGSRGGTSLHHYFPLDAEYEIRVFLRTDRAAPAPEEGKRLFKLKLPLKAGPHVVAVTFPQEFAEGEGPIPELPGAGGPPVGGPLDPTNVGPLPSIDLRLDGKRLKLFDIHPPSAYELTFPGALLGGPPVLDKVQIHGPYNATGPGETASRQRIFICHPDKPSDESDCATQILSTLTRRAFRRDVTSTDVSPFLGLYQRTRQNTGFESSIEMAVRAVLVSPEFLFHLERDPPGLTRGSSYRVSDFELASRLSFFLWSTIPDDELLNLASAHQLNHPDVLGQQVRRMLADSRSKALVDNFGGQWLGVRDTANLKPDAKTFPDFDDGLRNAFVEETTLFLTSIVRNDQSLIDLLNARYSFLNERLARFYGLPGVYGPQFRRVDIDAGSSRGGLLGSGSVLLATSHPNKTSPVLRGKWILENLLGDPPPPPPPNVPALDEKKAAGEHLTMRQQMEQHRSNATCASCHVRMDPLGFALENFDAVGQWRNDDSGKPIDTSGKLPDGSQFSGPGGLRNLLVDHSDEFVRTATEKLLTYALGRSLEPCDQPEVRSILREAGKQNYRFSALILGVVRSTPFEMRKSQE